jgi:guanine deaminase
MSLARVLRGRVLRPAADRPEIVDAADVVIEIAADGRIDTVRPPRAGDPAESMPGCVWLPGFVDAHLHFPQTRMVGTASGPLLDWLHRTTFPEEARFREPGLAAAVAARFCTALARHGTTSAAIYSSSDPTATDLLFRALADSGLRGLAGLVLMDRDAPEALCVPVGPAMEASARLHAAWHGHDGGRLRFVVTPRFGLSCTPALLRAAGRFADDHGLLVQTHISENRAEIAATAAVFPGSADYLSVYADHGLLGARTLLAHAIHFSGADWDRVAAVGARVAHCPDSNFFLGSGCMDLSAAQSRGVRVGIGTDVGAGRSFSVPRCAALGYDASLVVGAPQGPAALLWHATRGGALALGLDGEVGCVDAGYAADLVAWPLPPEGDPGSAVEHVLFRFDAPPPAAVLVQGRLVAGALPG